MFTVQNPFVLQRCYGGGELCRTLAEAKLVDPVEVAAIPVFIGGGIPLLPPTVEQTKLRLTGLTVCKNRDCLARVFGSIDPSARRNPTVQAAGFCA